MRHSFSRYSVAAVTLKTEGEDIYHCRDIGHLIIFFPGVIALGSMKEWIAWLWWLQCGAQARCSCSGCVPSISGGGILDTVAEHFVFCIHMFFSFLLGILETMCPVCGGRGLAEALSASWLVYVGSELRVTLGATWLALPWGRTANLLMSPTKLKTIFS